MVKMSDVIAAVMLDFNVGRDKPLAPLIGERHLSEHYSPPRIVWIPRDDSFVPGRLVGGRPVPLWGCVATYSAHIWGETQDDARDMEFNLVSAIYRTMHSASQKVSIPSKPTGATWRNVGELQGLGVLLELSVAFELLVEDRPAAVVAARRATGDVSEVDPTQTISIQVP